jgi:hypothetical protein
MTETRELRLSLSDVKQPSPPLPPLLNVLEFGVRHEYVCCDVSSRGEGWSDPCALEATQELTFERR